jgi:hypothetical protein
MAAISDTDRSTFDPPRGLFESTVGVSGRCCHGVRTQFSRASTYFCDAGGYAASDTCRNLTFRFTNGHKEGSAPTLPGGPFVYSGLCGKLRRVKTP